MKIIPITYKCDFCGKESRDKSSIAECEIRHILAMDNLPNKIKEFYSELGKIGKFSSVEEKRRFMSNKFNNLFKIIYFDLSHLPKDNGERIIMLKSISSIARKIKNIDYIIRNNARKSK